MTENKSPIKLPTVLTIAYFLNSPKPFKIESNKVFRAYKLMVQPKITKIEVNCSFFNISSEKKAAPAMSTSAQAKDDKAVI